MSKVALVKCDSYEYEKIRKSVNKGIDLIGGVEKFSNKNQSVLLKPNLLMAFPPEKGATTHPAVFKAVAEIFKKNCKKLNYGDSPGFGSPLSVAKKTGIFDVAEEIGVELADFKKGREIFFEKGIQNKKFYIANGVLENDVVISIPKLKTHGFQKITCSIKNQFGCIPGLIKSEYHVKMSSAYEFARMLVDLDRFVNPKLYVVDGIEAMEGNGPSGGIVKRMNLLLFSSDPIALDATICRIIGVNPELVPTNIFGKETGHGTYLESEIEIVGDDIKEFLTHDFDVDRSKIKEYKKSGMIRILSNILLPKPYIDKNKCVKCGVCINVCPVKPDALNWGDEKNLIPPVYDYSKCIRCFCCQELCPENAINIKKPLLRKFI